MEETENLFFKVFLMHFSSVKRLDSFSVHSNASEKYQYQTLLNAGKETSKVS